MGISDGLAAWPLIAGQALVAWLSDRNYRSLPGLYGSEGSSRYWGSVDIVVPARNEEHRLPALLRSLRQLRYSDRSVLVVDDGSFDQTAQVARAEGARVVRLDGPPPGWVGKSFACQTGAEATGSPWILFTDADTVHSPRSLDRALEEAERCGAGLLSLLPRQQCTSFWERLLLPYAYALYFVGVIGINRRGGAAVANGQYLLFRRAAYERIGGHAAVRSSLIEDVALARLAQARGEKVVLARGEADLEVRMYAGLPALWEGFSKNAFRFVTVSPRTGIPTVVAGLLLGLAVPASLRARSPSARLLLLAVPAAGLVPWLRRYRVPLYYAPLFPLAVAVFQLLALDSMRRVLLGQTWWKGRRY